MVPLPARVGLTDGIDVHTDISRPPSNRRPALLVSQTAPSSPTSPLNLFSCSVGREEPVVPLGFTSSSPEGAYVCLQKPKGQGTSGLPDVLANRRRGRSSAIGWAIPSSLWIRLTSSTDVNLFRLAHSTNCVRRFPAHVGQGFLHRELGVVPKSGVKMHAGFDFVPCFMRFF